jgi:CDP-glucose 4,6-dehydratase
MHHGRFGVIDLSSFSGKSVLVTGHTGFKGTWLCHVLSHAGAQVTGYALPPPNDRPSLFVQSALASRIRSVFGDVRDREALIACVREVMPDIVFHLAAQPIVRRGYRFPAETYETNVMGTVNLMESLRAVPAVVSCVNVTTDKVYENKERQEGYRESDRLCGHDPYANSKSCSELVTYSYRVSYFSDCGAPAVSTARSGNVIGGGDYAEDRVIPDCVRAAESGDVITLRNPGSVRPYQHVLECLSGYLALALAQARDRTLSGAYNFGPDESGCVSTGALVDFFCAAWPGVRWQTCEDGGPHESGVLRLDSAKARSVLGWSPKWDIATAVRKTVEFARCRDDRARVACVHDQIAAYFGKGRM